MQQQSWHDRVATLERALNLGIEVCTGGHSLGESWEDRLSLALSLKEHNVRHVPINFLVAHKGTALEGMKPLSSSEALSIIALFRHVLPEATLRICGGRPQIVKDRQHEIFKAGANALMTGNYLTTHGYTIEQDVAMIEGLQLKVSF